MKTLLTAFLILLSTSAFAVQINGVTGIDSNGGAGAAGLQIFKYYGLWSGDDIQPEFDLLNSFLPLDSTFHVSSAAIPGGLEDYAAAKGYSFTAELFGIYEFSFADYLAEIDAGHPVSLMADYSLTGLSFIEITGVGYDIIDGIPYYLSVNTWGTDDTVYISPWAEASTEYAWGITYAITITPDHAIAPVPEPSTGILLLLGLLGFIGYKFRCRIVNTLAR